MYVAHFAIGASAIKYLGANNGECLHGATVVTPHRREVSQTRGSMVLNPLVSSLRP